MLDTLSSFYYDDPVEQAPAAGDKCGLGTMLIDDPSATGHDDPEYDSRRVYIKTMRDRAMPVSVQDEELEKSQERGTGWSVRRIDSSHCPFDSKAAELAQILKEIAEDQFRLKILPEN